MTEKKLYLGSERDRLEEYARANGLNDSEAARRLINQGIAYENEPGLTEALARESLMLTAFSTILLAIFSTIEPNLFPFTILTFIFMIGLIVARFLTQARHAVRLREHVWAVITR